MPPGDPVTFFHNRAAGPLCTNPPLGLPPAGARRGARQNTHANLLKIKD